MGEYTSVVEALEAREDLKNTEKYVKGELEKIDNYIKSQVALNQPALFGDFEVAFVEQSRSGIDSDKLKREEPSLFKKYVKVTTYNTLKIKRRVAF